MAASEFRPLMEENAGTRNTTLQFLRSFSIISDDSDFDELDEPDTPGDYIDGPCGDVAVHHTPTAEICVDTIKVTDHAEGKIIPYTNVHKPRKGFTHTRPDCWMREPVKVAITDVKREEHPHRPRKAFNPNLYNIEVTHGEYKWTVRRRYKHFDSLHKALRLFRARYTLPMPSKQHREMRQSIREERKERKIKKKQTKKICRFPKKPEWLVRGEALEKRRGHLEQYLQRIVESKWYRNHTELLKFLDVSELSFINKLGQKWKEGDVNKCSGGRRISIGCCGCLKKYHVAGRWSDRWLIVKDTFVAYTRPSDGVLCDVMLMDSDFKVESGMNATGAPHGLLITNLSRVLLAKCWTSRKADEWEEGIHQAAITTGKQFTEPNRYDSYAPVREKSYARWFVDGSTYFEAVADALEKAKEEIFITDWWLSPEIYLKRHVTDREKWRLDEILARKAKSGVKVFILLYKELEIALTINSWYSKNALRNKCPENIKVIRHPDHVAGGNRVLLWAHHEKMVVIDQKTAFLGGLDLCYGRWDDDQHRMTDLGSVTFNSSSNDDIKQTTERDNPNVLNPSSHNGAVNRHKNHLRKMKAASNIPSPILETQESNIGDSVEIEDHAGNEPTGSHTQPSINSNDIETRSQQIRRSADDLHIAGIGHSGIDSTETARHSLCSEKDFGSGDKLTDNDSLENVNKTGYTNVIAEVTVHSEGTAGSSYNHTQQKSLSITGASTDGSQPGSVTPCSPKCNNSQNNEISAVHSNDLTLVNGDYYGNKKVERQVSSSSLSLKIEDIPYEENREVDLDKIEKQIIRDNDCSEEGLTTPKKDTDLNKNETKAMVRFKGDSEVKEENIVPTQAVLFEGSPRVKKDAAAKRETWASRKLRKRFGFKGDKYEEDDATDGAKSDKEKSDSDDESGGSRLRHKWRMVLNIKKLEHASKRPEDEDTMAPVSPRSRVNPHSPRQPLTTRIRQSMPFRTQRQDSDDELYFSLYPWKKMWGKDDGGPVTVKSVMKTSVADDYEGLEGSSKLWIGKDYVNFIHKDPVDVANPFEDFIARDKTPRMPWHDIGAVVYGKAARDVARHFIRRWNFCKTLKFKTKKEYPLLMPKCYTKCDVAQGIKDITYEVNSQILRSVSKWSAGINKVEMSIHNAYIDCIEKAKHYIYIENQFFISQVGDHSQVKNEIAEALLKRIEKAYRAKETFRVYVVLPLLPAFEGEIGANGGYAIQAVLHWNYKSISKGPNSLFQQLQNRVDDPKKYLLFCGLRSHAELAGKLVTELVYVHSKLMIVDDDTVIIGSANINDRSMLGNRDSEMAVLVEDTQKFMVKMDGKDHMVGNFASSLRRTIFREHLGIGEHDFDIDLTDPVSDKFYKNVWLHQASMNTTIYYKVFKCIPDDHIKTFYEIKETSASPLAETDPAAAKEELKKVKGRLVLMPLYFLEREETIMAAGANKEGLMPMKLWL